ncbi:MAG: threonine aldolase [Treponema sp.]|jgi:threonine aldolase|nr:threonine aldolase [Treponema sp.]
MIDIRSDTVTFPTQAMRKAMAEAEVGDDVYGDDPTVKKLEALGAEVSGKEAAVFVPSGTFGNQLALFTWCPRGSEVLLGEECHIVQHEAGAAAIIAGVQTRPVPAPDGIITVKELAPRYRSTPNLAPPPRFAVTAGRAYDGRDPHVPASSLVCVENAHSSGRAVPLAAMDPVRDFARKKALPLHLDGARLYNAAAALGCRAGDIAARADSVMFCLSKGLCAPVGSLLAGPKDFIEEARSKRKIMGGGMRQAGVLAAAGIVALTEHPPLLEADHRRARELERGLGGIPGISVEAGDINMVFFSWDGRPGAGGKTAGGEKTAANGTSRAEANPAEGLALRDFFRERGVLINPPEAAAETERGRLWKFRFVTHYWIGDKELETILAVSREAFTEHA